MSVMDSLKGALLVLMLIAVMAIQGHAVLQKPTDDIPPDHAMLQKPIDIPPEILEWIKQGKLESDPAARKPGPPIKLFPDAPSVPFPLARPSMNNILAICQNGNRRPRYTKDMLPTTGYGYLHRQANAVNQLESWFPVCCSNGTQDEELILCCAQQAWEKSLSSYCEDEFTIKTSHFYCCKKYGQERWDCFEEEAPDPLYQSSGDVVLAMPTSTIQGFEFNPSSCQKTSVSEINPRQEMVTEPTAPSLMMPRMLIPRIPESFRKEGWSGQRVSSSRFMKPSVTFPLAPPTATNIFAICQYSNQRPRYPKDTLRTSGFNHLFHQAIAVNELESWYTVCCDNGTQDNELTLCCAQQAWVKSLIAFCRREFGIKSNHHHCCTENGPEKWHCFERAASGASYQPSGHEVSAVLPSIVQGFDFDPNSCENISILGFGSRVLTEKAKTLAATAIGFPPGRPNSDNIEPICGLHKQRPQYLTNCLHHTGFDRFANHFKAMDRLEKGFGHCCKGGKDAQACAEGKWKKMVDGFCRDEKKVQMNQFECCKKQRGEERYDCFGTAAPNQYYMVASAIMKIELPPILDFCHLYQALQKMKCLPFTVGEEAENCCILEGNEKSSCLQLQLDNLLAEACKGHDPSLAQVKQKCCKETANRHSKCLTKMLIRSFTKANRVNEKCPLTL